MYAFIYCHFLKSFYILISKITLFPKKTQTGFSPFYPILGHFRHVFYSKIEYLTRINDRILRNQCQEALFLIFATQLRDDDYEVKRIQ